MNALLVNLLNVAIVLASIGLAIYVGSRVRAVRYSVGMVVVGVAVYVYEIYFVVAGGLCADLGDAAIEFVVGASECIGIGGRHLAYAQVLILAGSLVLLFRPLRRLLERVAKDDNAT